MGRLVVATRNMLTTAMTAAALKKKSKSTVYIVVNLEPHGIIIMVS